MFKINFKKAIGAVALASVLLLSAAPAPAKAETFPGLKWVMEKYSDAMRWELVTKSNGEKWVNVYTKLSNGKVDVQEYKCEVMYQNRCYVID
ncbi:hypothetical protein QF033_002497 [Bacillus pumilus]|uniref:hypothetical protein n=1 Tax=Bacillus pumilus TaxID=1408 RepID=UPI0027839550|nr:hypothetical protein [Bacillus pumilus]MDQ0817919.1 hypothetical protein [Bacillus pumilus]